MRNILPYDYDEAASRYDQHRKGGGPYINTLARLAGTCRARRVLELGAGTGNNVRPFIERHPCTLAGLERSSGMLQRAKDKGVAKNWVQGDAMAVPFQDGAFDFVFAVLVLHHITDLDGLLAECHRVLKSGYAAFVTSPHDFIRRHPMNQYFPSFERIDLARFQPIEAITQAMRALGFEETGVVRDKGEPASIDMAYYKRIENRFISTYDLMPPDEYAEGLARLKADIEAKGQLDTLMCWECATVWGRKT